MKNLTDAEIATGVTAIVEPLKEYYWRDVEVRVVKNLPTSIVIEIRGEYEAPCKCSATLMSKIVEFLGAAGRRGSHQADAEPGSQGRSGARDRQRCLELRQRQARGVVRQS